MYSGKHADDQPIEWRTEPAGIVFHSTESLQAPFEASEARMIQRIGRFLLDFIRTQRSYHFVIDRFGRVYRVVAEDGVANHAGRSVWADSRGVYVNLNASFLSIAFEAQTDASMPLSSAQVHAARVLTDMLRGRFGIPAANCVTHAQVSVNPWNWRIGYHTDWASGLPFAALGLPDNYAQPLPAIALFGFEYDDVFLKAVGRPWDRTRKNSSGARPIRGGCPGTGEDEDGGIEPLVNSPRGASCVINSRRKAEVGSAMRG